jgi:hypothetical protein
MTWRDAPAAAGLSVGGLIAAVIALALLVGLIVIARLRRGSSDRASSAQDVSWADPETRPRF